MNDVLVIGAGPAGLSLATACAAAGLTTRCVAPDPTEAWLPRYGAWADELADLALPESCVEARWDQTVAYTPKLQDLGRGYVRLSTEGFQTHLLERAEAAGVVLQGGTVEGVDPEASRSVVTLSDGERVHAKVVVDASGHGANFVERTGTQSLAWQVAYGQLLRVEGGHPWPLGQMVLMDFRLPSGSDRAWKATPTFLYAMPIDHEHVFVEETSLVHTEPPSLEALRARLAVRLESMGVAGEVLEEEHCRIRMTGPAAVTGQRTLGYGAAGDMIHPATGYQLARVLREAPGLAAAIAGALEAGGPEQAASDAWATLWPADRRRSWALYRFGADTLCSLDHAQTLKFFEAFFKLPAAQWQGFQSATLPPKGVAKSMTTFFLSAPLSVRTRLLAAGVSHSGASLLKSIALG